MKLHNQIILGLVLGAACGVAANALFPGAKWVHWIGENIANPVGQVFLRMLIMTVVPLVFASITLAVAGLGDLRRLGRIGGKTLAYFALSTALSTALGLFLVNLFRPGDGIDPALRTELLATYGAQAQGLQAGGEGKFGVSMLVNIVPRNPVQAAAQMDMLAIIFFALCFGAALTLLPKERAEPMIRVLEALGDVVVKLIGFAMRLAPFGVFGLIFFVTSRFGWGMLVQLGEYVLVVLGGLALYALVGLSGLVFFLGHLNPIAFWKRTKATVVTSFSTSSSNATLPTNITVAENELKLPPSVSRFVLPLGATMNMNGTSLYEGVTVLFLAQVFGVELSLGQQIVVLLLSVITAIGAAGVPGGSLPLIVVVLATVGVPPEGIAIILGVDRILDMCRTILNTTGDLTAAVYIARTEAGWRPEMLETEEKPAAGP